MAKLNFRIYCSLKNKTTIKYEYEIKIKFNQLHTRYLAGLQLNYNYSI